MLVVRGLLHSMLSWNWEAGSRRARKLAGAHVISFHQRVVGLGV